MLKMVHKKDYIAFNVELVKAVEKYPCLYDYTLKEYCNREFVQDAWEKIAKNFNCTAKECKDTWKNLRIVFSRNVKKRPATAGSKRKPYYLLESMSYLIPFMKFDNSSPKQLKPSSEVIDYETTSDEQTSIRDEEDDNIINFSNTANLEIAIKEECDSGDERFFLPAAVEPPSKKQKTQPEISNDVLQIETLKDSPETNEKSQFSVTGVTSLCDCSKSNNSDVSKTSRGNFKHQFLMSLYPDVEDMTDAQFRSFRFEVCKLVNNIFTFQPPKSQPFSRTSS